MLEIFLLCLSLFGSTRSDTKGIIKFD